MQQTWRWFGPNDRVTLQDAAQAGAQGIVTAIHEVPAGIVWPQELIRSRQQQIERAGLRWTVVESLDVTDAIKARAPGRQEHTAAFVDSLRNLAACGIKTVAYNLMPLFSWMRTHLHEPLSHGGYTTAFRADAFAAFDIFLLQRKQAESDWSTEQQQAASQYFRNLTLSEQQQLQQTILCGLPGGNGRFTLQEVRKLLDAYRDIDAGALRENAAEFLKTVVPIAEELGVRLCVHPDDPPRPLLGLPRIVSTAEDLAWLLQCCPSPSNALTFCTGALGVRADNDLQGMVKHFAPSIGFAHLRSTQRDAIELDKIHPIESFFEAAHLEGDADLIEVVIELVKEQQRRKQEGDTQPLPFRADHGQELLNDHERAAQSAYPAVGRLRGLAELRGAIFTAERLLPGAENA